MTDTTTRDAGASVDELLTLVSRIADQARPGEELEVYASRGVETDVRALLADLAAKRMLDL